MRVKVCVYYFFFSKVENFSRYASLGDGGGGERERKKRNYTHGRERASGGVNLRKKELQGR